MNKKTIKYVAIGLVAAIVVVGGGYFGYNALHKSKATSAVSYRRVTARMGSIDVTVSATGTVSAGSSKDIYPVANNVNLEALNVKEGDTVKKGQVLAKMDDTSAQQNVSKAEANLNQQNLQEQKLEKSLAALAVKAPVSGTVKAVNISTGDDVSVIGKYHQQDGLILIQDSSGNKYPISTQSGTVSKIYVSVGTEVSKGDTLFKLDGSDIESNISSQDISIQEAQADLKTAEDNLSKMTITSPIDGVVAAVNYNVGDTVQNSTALLTVMDPSQMETVVPVDELDIDKVKVGQDAQVTMDALPDKTFTGKVTNIATLGTTTNGVTTYNATVTITNPTGVKVGMSTNVTINVQSKDNIVVVPVNAVRKINGQSFVYVPSSSSTTSSSSSDNSGSGRGNYGGYGGNGSGYGGNRGNFGGLASGDVTMKKVETGIANDSYIEIVSGLNEGDVVLIPVYTSTTTSSNQQSSGGLFGQVRMGGSGGGGYNRSSGGSSSKNSGGSSGYSNGGNSGNSNNGGGNSESGNNNR